MERIQQYFHDRTAWLLSHMHDSCNGLGHKARVGQSRKFHPVNAVCILTLNLGDSAQGETGFAAAGSSCQRNQPRRGQESHDFPNFARPPNEAGQHGRDHGGRAPCVLVTLSIRFMTHLFNPLSRTGNKNQS